MRFVLVNQGLPGASNCAACSRALGSSYLRHVPTQRRYCDHDCYRRDQLMRASPWLAAMHAPEEIAPAYQDTVQIATSLVAASCWGYAVQLGAISQSLTEALLCMRDLMRMRESDGSPRD